MCEVPFVPPPSHHVSPQPLGTDHRWLRLLPQLADDQEDKQTKIGEGKVSHTVSADPKQIGMCLDPVTVVQEQAVGYNSSVINEARKWFTHAAERRSVCVSISSSLAPSSDADRKFP